VTEKTRKRIKRYFWRAIGFLAFAAAGFFVGGRNLFAPKKELPLEFFDLTDWES